MTSVRIAKAEDKKAFYDLWKICFGDSDAFCDWFFTNRFAPDYSVVLETEGEIVSCMQAFPYTLWIRGKEIPGAMLCGVSTHPAHRKKGYMGQIFTYEMKLLREKGCLVTPHTPAVLPSYFSFGHFPVADAAYLTCDCVPAMKGNTTLVPVADAAVLFPLYTAFAGKYSGMILRTKEDFLRKTADYAADGGKCAAYIKDNEIKGYAFYYKTETELTCVEAVAEEYAALMEGLLREAEGLAFSAKLPPETDVAFPFTNTERKQKGVMGLCNAPALLHALQLEIPYAFRLTDTVIPENNGVFDFQGNPSADEPVFEISAGHLLQVLVGYHSLAEIKENLKIFDEEKYKELDAFLPKQKCYIIDEY